MEIANFIASYVLSVLTLIGLIIAIVYYFQQNRIILDKNRVENFHRLNSYLLEINFNQSVDNFTKEHISEIKSPNNDTFKNRNKNNFRSIQKNINFALHQYNNATIDLEMFDYFYRDRIFFFWVIIKHHNPSIKETSDLDINTDELEKYINKLPKKYLSELMKYLENFHVD